VTNRAGYDAARRQLGSLTVFMNRLIPAPTFRGMARQPSDANFAERAAVAFESNPLWAIFG